MFEIGRVCIKIAGRDAGQKCVIVDKLEGKYVVIDGMTRRRKCNTLHLEPLDQVLSIEKNASHDQVVEAFKSLGLEVKTTQPKQKTVKPKAVRHVKEKPEEKGKKTKDKKEKKKEVKKEKAEKKEEKK